MTLDRLLKTKQRIRQKHNQEPFERETDETYSIVYQTQMCWYAGMGHHTGTRPRIRYDINKQTGFVTVTHYRQTDNYVLPSPETAMLMPFEPHKRKVYSTREFYEYLETGDHTLGTRVSIPRKETVKGQILNRKKLLAELIKKHRLKE